MAITLTTLERWTYESWQNRLARSIFEDGPSVVYVWKIFCKTCRDVRVTGVGYEHEEIDACHDDLLIENLNDAPAYPLTVKCTCTVNDCEFIPEKGRGQAVYTAERFESHDRVWPQSGAHGIT